MSLARTCITEMRNTFSKDNRYGYNAAGNGRDKEKNYDQMIRLLYRI